MSITNIYIAGVGGQGLVLTTKILAETAFEEGFDIKTSDVIGLSQRGGMVCGSVRFGEKVHSSFIPIGETDFLLALEELEALRWSSRLKSNACIIVNRQNVYPNRVLLEKEDYPEDIQFLLHKAGFETYSVYALSEAKVLGNIKVSNIILLGKLSTLLPFKAETWEKVIAKNVPQKTVELNQKAFFLGRKL